MPRSIPDWGVGSGDYAMSRQVQNGTGRKAGQKRRALACAAAPEPRAENRRLPVFEHGEEPPFDAPEHRGTCPCFLPCHRPRSRFPGDRAIPIDCFRLKAKRRAAERVACLSLAKRVTGEWFTPFRACLLRHGKASRFSAIHLLLSGGDVVVYFIIKNLRVGNGSMSGWQFDKTASFPRFHRPA